MVGMATYSVTPTQAGKHFKKIQCFCFEEQRLQADEVSAPDRIGNSSVAETDRGSQDVDMPVLFFMDPELLDDEQMDGVNDVTLSYTFFEVNPSDDVINKRLLLLSSWQATDSDAINASIAAGATLGLRTPARSNYAKQ